MKCGKDSCSNFFRRIWLLIWKNYLLHKRHPYMTTFEVLVPALIPIIFLTYLRTFVFKGSQRSIPDETIYPVVRESDMISTTKDILTCFSRNCSLAFVPNNEAINSTMTLVRDYLKGTRFKVKGFDTEEDVELYVSHSTFNKSLDRIVAAVIFTNGITSSTSFQSKISYKIRMVDESELPNTGIILESFQVAGPINKSVEAYWDRGFSGLQIAIDKILIRGITNESGPELNTQGFPYPPYVEINDFNQFYGRILPQMILAGFMGIVVGIIQNVVSEKATGINELMKVMGLPNWMHWMGWMLDSMILRILSITLLVILFFIEFNKSTGAVLIHSDPTVWWFVLVLYAMSTTAFCFFISVFFQKPILASYAGFAIWYFSWYGISSILELNYESVSFETKMASALIPNLAFHWAIRAMCSFEGQAVGAHWSNFFEPISPVDELSVSYMCLMLVVDTVMYLTLTVYFESIIPSEYGLRKPWYFIFQPSTWIGHKTIAPNQVNSVESHQSFLEKSKPGFEPEQDGSKPAGITLDQLTKRFNGGKIAVDGVTLKMYDGEITALLGHNGAGKTTIMSMLTGLFAPSSGTATVNGYDITTSMDEIRHNLGLCPQHNMLFDKLSVEEHLIFFGCLKGLTSSQAKVEMTPLLDKLQLRDKQMTLAGVLSGGQKRKLSLGIALIGGSKVVILDEPTSGMDPQSRRAIWDLLLEMRGERTIILTTHFMDEADVLGDKIAIMAAGKVVCHGTSFFLKKHYGAGYTLKLSINPSSNTSTKILTTVREHVPNANFKTPRSANSSEVVINLPDEDKQVTKSFPGLFSKLNQVKAELGIKTIGLSLTTMDDVFIKVGELGHNDSSNVAVKANTSLSVPVNETGGALLPQEKLKGFFLGFQQFWGLLVKRFVCTSRSHLLFLGQCVIPVILLIVAILTSNLILKRSKNQPPLKMSLNQYRNPKVLFTYNDTQLGKAFEKLVGSAGHHVTGSIIPELLNIGVKDLSLYRDHYITGAEFSNSSSTALFSSIPPHASPLAINLVSNAILNSLTANTGKGAHSIEMTIHPMKSIILDEIARPDLVTLLSIPLLFAFFISNGLAFMAASFIVFPIEEKLCKAKQLQMMTGMSPFTYWGCYFLWDLFIMTLIICVMLVCFPIFQEFDAFTTFNGGGVIFLILLTFGFSAISFSYLISQFANKVSGGFRFVSSIHTFIGMLFAPALWALEILQLANHFSADIIRIIGRCFPAFGLTVSLMRYATISIENSHCNVIMSKKETQLICKLQLPRANATLQQCCHNCQELGICFKPRSYLNWEDQSMHHQTIPGIAQELLYIFSSGVVYKILLMLIEYKHILRCFDKPAKTNFQSQAQVNDDDVSNENMRVETLIREGRVDEDAFVVENLCKNYGYLTAVSHLTFGVHHGECFGLLGVNGAGKTTAFRMLTGDETPSAGNAYSLMLTLLKNRKAFIANIGYCPQFDGIVGVLTGSEMLDLFCRLRGVPRQFIRRETDKWLSKLGLSESGHIQCSKYSGGMKRRLSAAMAMIGDSPILLLDEPTSGVDPIARRQFWDVIRSVQESGQTVILTSHTMDECEALCSRIGIMVNGQFQCFGEVQHLKNKFAEGFSLTLKLKPAIQNYLSQLAELQNDINQKFTSSVLKDQHQNILQYQVLDTSTSWEILFTNMEELKDKYQDLIEEYSVNEATLEEVFLAFARKQYPENPGYIPFCKKLMTCQF